MNDYPFCSVVIPAFNEEKGIKKSLISLLDQSYPRNLYEIIVVDNGSSDSTPRIASAYADMVISMPDGNVGAVRNYGIAQASGDIIICTDADCLVPKNWIERGVSLLLSKDKQAFGGGLKTGDDAGWIEKYWILNESGTSTQQKALMGSSIFIWRKDFYELGAFNESITSGEDSDLYERALEKDVSVTISQDLSVIHLGSPKTALDFITRQIWHSENYLLNIRKSLKDKVFWLTFFYLCSLFLALIETFANNLLIASTALAFSQIPAVTLSLKRIIRANWSMTFINDFVKILVLDNLYLIGRSFGILKGLAKIASRHSGRPAN